jgi:hypothetical protein
VAMSKIMYNAFRVALVFIIGCGLMACSPRQEVLEISTTPVIRPTLVLPEVDELVARPVTWIVITPDNFEEKIAELAALGEAIVVFGVTSTGYENLSLNLSDIRALVEQQQQIIVAYDRYYNQSIRALDGAVTIN